MAAVSKTREQLALEVEELSLRLEEAEETLEAIRSGSVDALVVSTAPGQEQLFTLKGADRVYRIFLESVSQGALTLDPDGLILFANSAAEELLHSSAALVGASLRTLVRSQERERFDALLDRGREESAQAEVRVRAAKGGRPLLVSLRPFEDRGARMIAAVLTDLTGQKATEAALESERLAHAIFEQAGEPILVCDREGVVVQASRAAATLAGRQPLFHDFDEVLPLVTHGAGSFSLREHARGRRIRGLEVTLVRDDRPSFSLILNTSPLRTKEQGLIGNVVTLTDITRLRLAERARERLLRDLEQANRELATIESLSEAGLQSTSVDELARAVVTQVNEAMGADHVWLLVVEGGKVRLAAGVPPADDGLVPADKTKGFVNAIVGMGRSLFVEDVAASRLVTPEERRSGAASLLGSPLLEGDDVLGALCVGWKDAHVAGGRQQRFLEIMAARAARGIWARMLADQRDEQRLKAEELAMQLAEVNVRLLEKQESLELLQELTALSTSSLSLSEIGTTVLERAFKRLDLAAATLYAVDDEENLLRAVALLGFSAEVLATADVLPMDEETVHGRILGRDLKLATHETVGSLMPPLPTWLSGVTVGRPARWIILPLKKDGRALGVMSLTFAGERPFEEAELALYRSIAELLSSAFQNARAYEAEAVAQRQQVTLEERNRLARDLHDSITQSLFAAALKAEALTLDGDMSTGSVASAAEVRRLTRGALAQMRTLLRELRSESLEDVPIEALLQNVVEATEGRTNIDLRLAIRGQGEPPRRLHTPIYRIAQEALNNVARHSKASAASVQLEVEPSSVRLSVHDDGCGFHPGDASLLHLGIQSMQERAAEAGAALKIVSEPGEGTLVVFDWQVPEVRRRDQSEAD